MVTCLFSGVNLLFLLFFCLSSAIFLSDELYVYLALNVDSTNCLVLCSQLVVNIKGGYSAEY